MIKVFSGSSIGNNRIKAFMAVSSRQNVNWVSIIMSPTINLLCTKLLHIFLVFITIIIAMKADISLSNKFFWKADGRSLQKMLTLQEVLKI